MFLRRFTVELQSHKGVGVKQVELERDRSVCQDGWWEGMWQIADTESCGRPGG